MATVIQEIASRIVARSNCERLGNADWHRIHGDIVRDIGKDYLPRGSGIDSGSYVDQDASRPDRVVICTEFHHMNDVGMYDGWTSHSVVVTPTFDGIDVRVTGRDRNGIKDYLADVFRDALMAELPLERIVRYTDKARGQ